MPRVSVCFVTTRPGGLDVLLCGLTRQEFDDFEVVLVDALYQRRKELVSDIFSDRKIRVRHTPPRLQNFPIDSVPQYRNTAIAKASGELILWCVDYSYIPPTCVQNHWKYFEMWNKQRCAMGAHEYRSCPPLAFDIPAYAPFQYYKPHEIPHVTYGYDLAPIVAYVSDIECGFYDPYMYSIFKESIETPERIQSLEDDMLFYKVDPKLQATPKGILDGTFFHAKNESVSKDWCLAVNGFDECYVAHAYDDTDFGVRINHHGGQWHVLDMSDAISIVNPRHVFPHGRRMVANPRFQEEFYKERERDPACIKSSNQYSLSDFCRLDWWY